MDKKEIEDTSLTKKMLDKPVFSPLIPTSDAELGIYKDALNYVFSNNGMKNIALSGAYGSGKSSIIRTYEKENKKEFLYISLAHFTSNDNNSSTPCVSVLEWKILNQLIHQIKPDKIPQTNFRVKRSITKLEKCRLAIGSGIALLFTSLFLHTVAFNRWVNFYNTLNTKIFKCIFGFTTCSEFRLITLILCVGLVGFGLFELLVLQKNRQIIKKLKIKNAEIDMFENSNESYFDKYLNEVLYLFDNAEQNVFIFEDMDRFDSYLIFERLREVNTLINHSHKTNNIPIRFFYLIRDDIFTNKDRTKFFDLIIPIVPVVDGSNSYDKFIEKLKEHGIFEHFDSSFIQGFSLYIDEMRLLLNICNEYQIYYRQIEKAGTGIDRNKMLAMITFKNLFPYDFAQLQLGKGFVFGVLVSKDELIHEERKRLENEIAVLKSKLKNAEDEHLKSDEEVDILYSDNLNVSFPNFYKKLRNNNTYPLNQAKADRKENIANRLNEKKISDEIHDLEKQLVILRSRRLKDLFQRENIYEIFESIKYTNRFGKIDNFESIKNDHYFALLIFLIRNGHIDETYKNYMTYFYPNSMTAKDAAFCHSITDQKAMPPEYLLENPTKIIDYLPPEYFRQIEALNFSLLDYLLATKDSSKQLSLIIEQIVENKHYDFIHNYLLNGSEIEIFVTTLNRKYPTFFYELQLNKALPYKDIIDFVYITFFRSTDEEIISVNIDNCLTKYISESSLFFKKNDHGQEFIIPRFKMLEVSFTFFIENEVSPELLLGIYENNLYKITFDNITFMLRKFYKIEYNYDFYHCNYSLILSSQDSPLAIYINNNIGNYFNIILNNCKNKITDDEETALSVLNNENIPVELKQKYLSFLKTKLPNLVDVKNKSLWTNMIIYNESILYSERNVIDYFHSVDDEFDNNIVDWINQQSLKLDFSKKELFDIEKDERDIFFDSVIQCNQLNDEKYSEFTSTIGLKIDNFSFDSIDEDKLLILINNSIIKMNADNLLFLRENYSFEVISRFIVKEIDIYIKIIDEKNELLNVNELEFIISTNSNVSIENQIKLLKLMGDALSIINKPFTEQAKIHILLFNFLENDFDLLVKEYDNFPENIRKIIVELIISRIMKIIEEKYNITKILFNDLANSSQLNEDQIKYILALAISNIGENDCFEYLIKYGLKQFVDVFDKNKKPQFYNTKLNEYILDCFINWDKIKEYNVGEDGKIHIKR